MENLKIEEIKKMKKLENKLKKNSIPRNQWKYVKGGEGNIVIEDIFL